MTFLMIVMKYEIRSFNAWMNEGEKGIDHLPDERSE